MKLYIKLQETEAIYICLIFKPHQLSLMHTAIITKCIC